MTLFDIGVIIRKEEKNDIKVRGGCYTENDKKIKNKKNGFLI